jgi:Leucine-rich repeat (LRR) protein
MSHIFRSLDISLNRISRYPVQLGQLTNLKVLNLSGNRLTDLNVQKLTKLENLNAKSNLILQFPNLSFCKQLKTLDLSNNKIKIFPSNLSGLQHLSMIDIKNNELTNIDGIKDLKCVEINLNRNRINILPNSIISCKRLKVLRVEENCLSEICPEILKNSTISTLDFDGNLFDKKKLENTDGYEEYSRRYTQSKQKAE